MYRDGTNSRTINMSIRTVGDGIHRLSQLDMPKEDEGRTPAPITGSTILQFLISIIIYPLGTSTIIKRQVEIKTLSGRASIPI